MRCAVAILLIAIFICFSNEVRSSNKFKELSKGNWNKLHGSKKMNCKYIKCPTKVDRACVRVKNKKGYPTKTIYISVVNKCEIDYIRCHEDLEATLVPLEKCLHKMSADTRKLKKEANTTKKRLKRSPHIVTKTGNNRLAKQSRKLSSQFNKSPFHNKYSSLYFGPKRKAVYIEINTDNKNDDNENDNDRDNDHDNDHDGNHDNDHSNDNDHGNDHDNDRGNDHNNYRGNDHDNDRGNDHDNDRGNDHDNDRGNDHDNDRGNDHDNDRGNDHDNDHDNDKENDNEEENFNDNVESDRNDDREIKEYGDEHGDRQLMDGGEIEKEAQDTNTETEESLVGKEKDDKEIDDKELILLDVNSAKDNVYSKLAMDKDSQIEGHKSNEDENVNDENFNKKENVPKDTKETEANDEQTLDNHNNMEDFNEHKQNDEEGHKPVNEDQTLIITFDRKDKVDESEAENVETENLNDKTKVDNDTDDNEDRESQQGYVEEKVDSDRQTFNIHTETQKHANDNVKSKNGSNENEGSNDTLNAEETENQESEKGIETKQKETILININYKPKKATNNNAKNEKKNVEKEKTTTEKKVIDSDTSTEEDKKDVKTNDANKPHNGKKAEKQSEDNYDDVGKDPYNNDCPTVCPARDVMLCARCKEGVYRTFMSACHLRMFNCKHPEEKLELISRKPCILSAPFLNGMKTKGAVKKSGNEDKVLRYIRCREKGDPNDPTCNFGRRARKRRING